MPEKISNALLRKLFDEDLREYVRKARERGLTLEDMHKELDIAIKRRKEAKRRKQPR
jgi:hypothetical protein